MVTTTTLEARLATGLIIGVIILRVLYFRNVMAQSNFYRTQFPSTSLPPIPLVTVVRKQLTYIEILTVVVYRLRAVVRIERQFELNQVSTQAGGEPVTPDF